VTILHPHLSTVGHRVQCGHPAHDQPVLSVPIEVMPFGALGEFVQAHEHPDLTCLCHPVAAATARRIEAAS
jgi:hypothetical protein